MRDMIGYGGNLPDPKWPNKAKVAVQFVINYEEGGEHCILNGDRHSEYFISEMIGAAPIQGMRSMAMESLYEYGSRAGFWRLHDIFTSRQIPLTVFAVAKAMEQNPKTVEAMVKAGWDIASHGLRWVDYQYVPEAIEKEHIYEAIDLHTRLTGNRPLGWYQGRNSPNTARLIVEEGGFVYESDSYCDDLPYYSDAFGKQQLIIPYTLDVNDMRFVALNGFTEGEQFFKYLCDTFDQLYEEGERAPKMMSIGLHCRIVGKAGRARAISKFLDYILAKDRIWIASRLDIANHWLNYFPV
ncbi:allantoinase PuuE [Commensalibacter communis]|uniref:allantoinase PuuE n=1 Tax=Commensalibacter communis TaxID=2972786 RepID=UPI0022FF63FD|nr:allantoinase PuuE [Commensalibacter communis]CAI3957183.1 Peptidoglycan/xylan/chitin deacetylase [Commensalibacter communis]CAI3957463.1 Peptidoglycan/xylan/chitin deacetylase [Commensalibacter communis]